MAGVILNGTQRLLTVRLVIRREFHRIFKTIKTAVHRLTTITCAAAIGARILLT
jgi:hypothetical protein